MPNRIYITEEHLTAFKKESLETDIKFSIDCLNNCDFEVDAIQSFDIRGEIIAIDYLELVSLSELLEDGDDKEYLNDRISDFAYEIGQKLPKEFLLDDDDDKPLYLNKLRSKVRHKIVGENVILNITVHWELRGRDFNSMFKNVDMTKFIKRTYERPENYKPSEHKDGLSQFPVTVYGKEGEEPYLQPEIDIRLFRAWVLCEWMKIIFKCTYDPFFEKYGLIHRKDGYVSSAARFATPKDLDINKLTKSLSLAREYMSDEDILSVNR